MIFFYIFFMHFILQLTQVEDLAKVLEVLFDKSIVYDNDGNPIGFEKELSILPEYRYIIDELEEEGLLIDEVNQVPPEITPFLIKQNPKWAAAKEACFRREVKKHLVLQV